MKTILLYDGNAKREELSRLLRSRICRVVFTKVNGEERVMKCTLNRSLLPEGITNNGRGWHTSLTDTLSVWDLEKNEWRAFRVASVKEVNYNDQAHSFQ